jgi:hypothetical protein
MLGLEAPGDESFDVHLESFGGRVAEDLCSSRVPEDDPSRGGLRDDYRVAYALEEAAYP